jgi:hypothetical protein
MPVPRRDTSREPMQPSRFEKNANIISGFLAPRYISALSQRLSAIGTVQLRAAERTSSR